MTRSIPGPRTSTTHPLQIAGIQPGSGLGRIGITLAPGKKQNDAMTGAWARDLARGKPRSAIRGSGYIVHALEAALWAVSCTTDFRSAVLLAANLGDDADTTAAITGQLAGALYGAQAIPENWRRAVTWAERIEATADKLWSGS